MVRIGIATFLRSVLTNSRMNKGLPAVHDYLVHIIYIRKSYFRQRGHRQKSQATVGRQVNFKIQPNFHVASHLQLFSSLISNLHTLCKTLQEDLKILKN